MEGPGFHRRQRKRIEEQVVPAATTIYDLNSDLLAISHSLLGIGHFRYTDIACKLLLEASLAASDKKVTSMKCVTYSISCAEKYFEDEGTGYEQLKLFWRSAARYGRLEIMRWAHQQGYARVWSQIDESYAADNAVVTAAKYGQLDILKWLRENGCCPWYAEICAAAASGGHLSILQWLRENGCPPKAYACCSAAASGGHISTLQWLRENGCPWNADTCAAAARGGHISCIQWLRENGCDWSSRTCFAAARFGHLSCLQWLRENGCDWYSEHCSANAARGGHLSILQWLRENGGIWSCRTCAAAACGGHLSCLQWLRENGCPWDETTFFAPAGAESSCNRPDVLDYLIQQGCPRRGQQGEVNITNGIN